MTDQELEALLTELESDRVERKSSVADAGKIKRAMCALANDLPGHGKPGVIFVGINDDGSRAHLVVTDELLKQLSDLGMSGQIQPLPSMTVQKRVLRGWEVAVVVVQPSPFPPVRYDGRAYVRVGPTTRPASSADERRLLEKRRSSNLPFDMSPAPTAAVADLDLTLFQRVYLPAAIAPDVLAQNERPLEQQLAALRLCSLDGTPTILGVLAVGKDPRSFMPGSYVQFVRIEGTEITDSIIRDQKEIDGPLPELLRRLDEVLQAHVSVASNFTSQSTEMRRPDYPIVALQQIVRNAVLHRTYEGTNAPVRMTWLSDRIEVSSPGGPYGQVTPENFGRPGITDYRNPHVAEAMKVLGYAQRFGFGIAIARQELAKNGNPPIEFSVTDTHVLAVIRRRP
jgi:ATP-dependent DNA helicase RecG